MSLLDSIQNAVHKVLPEKKGIPLASSGGIGNGHAPFEDDVRANSSFVFVFSWLCGFALSLCASPPVHASDAVPGSREQEWAQDMKFNLSLRKEPT